MLLFYNNRRLSDHGTLVNILSKVQWDHNKDRYDFYHYIKLNYIILKK